MATKKEATEKKTSVKKTATKKAAPAVKAVPAKVARQVDYSYLRRPLLTEKSNKLSEHKNKVVTFMVDVRSTKTELKEAFERIFSVNVIAIRTVSTPAKSKRKVRGSSTTPSRKKAYITLKEGQTINVVEGI